MTNSDKKISAINWLQNKLINRENSIIFDHSGFRCFNLIQNFVEANDHPFKTPAIYYKAFPQESAAEFTQTLLREIAAKLYDPTLHSRKSLPEIVAAAQLKMVIIDQSHLYPLDTLDDLLENFAKCNVCLLLIGTYHQLKIAQILSHPVVSQWPKLTVNSTSESLPKTC